MHKNKTLFTAEAQTLQDTLAQAGTAPSAKEPKGWWALGESTREVLGPLLCSGSSNPQIQKCSVLPVTFTTRSSSLVHCLMPKEENPSLWSCCSWWFSLEIPGGPSPAQRMYQDKALTRGIWACFLHGSRGLWKTLSWISILHHTEGKLSFPLLFVHPVCLNSLRMVFGEAQWDPDPGKVRGFFNNSDSAESLQFPDGYCAYNVLIFFPLSEFPLSFLLFLLIFLLDKGDTDLWGQRLNRERAI